MRNWDFVAIFKIEIGIDDGQLYSLDTGENLNVIVYEEIREKFGNRCQLCIPVRYIGYKSSGNISGPADTWYPPEGDDEREYAGDCYLLNKAAQCFYLPASISHNLFNQFLSKIQAQPLEDVYDFET